MYSHILIATDGSERSAKGVSAGLALAKATGAKVTTLFVSEPFPSFDLVTKLGLYRNQEAIDRYEESCRQLAETVLSGAAAEAAAAAVACETVHVADSTPALAILETATTRGCDLIVVTSHGRTGLDKFLLGSQAARVVQGATIPVLVVR
jgi:nucleotide-binding universal stress UspA family protein